jgi:hypothetical protein
LDPAPFVLADAAGAGCAGSVCADAIAVAPNNEATARAEIASLERMEFLLIRISDAGVKTGEPNEGSLACERTQKSASHLNIDPNAIDASHNSALPKASAGTFRSRGGLSFPNAGVVQGRKVGGW